MKAFSFFKKTLLTLLCLFVFLIIGGFLCVHSYSRFDQDQQASYLAKYTPASEMIYTDVTPNNETIDKIEDLIASLPDNISSGFLKEWKIIISPNMPDNFITNTETAQLSEADDNSGDIVVLGYSDWHLRLIFLKAQPDPDAVYKVFAHELGHYFDYEFGSPSLLDEFGKVYEQCKDSFVEHDASDTIGYSKTSREEFFATAFKEYLLAPEQLKASAPKAYTFIDHTFNQVSNNPSATTTAKYDLQSALIVLLNKSA